MLQERPVSALRVRKSEPKGQQVVFVHLPKTGGMSLQSAIAGALAPGRSLRIGDAAEHAAFLLMQRAALSGYAFIGGHVSLAEAAPRVRADALFVTLLRDPVERLVSAFNYMASWKEHPLHAEFRDLGFADFVDTAGARLSGEACRQLTGAPTAEAAIPILESRYAMVATTPQLPMLAAGIAQWLGVAAPVMKRENVTPGQGRMTLDSATCERLLEITREDRALYTHVAAYHGGVLQRAA